MTPTLVTPLYKFSVSVNKSENEANVVVSEYVRLHCVGVGDVGTIVTNAEVCVCFSSLN